MTTIYAQDNTEKHRVRLKADYFKVIDGEQYIDIGAISKIEKETVDVMNINLIILNEINDEVFELGTVTTNMMGRCKFEIEDLSKLRSDSTNTYNLKIVFKGNDSYKKASKSLSFKEAIIEANIISKDTINYVTAILKDKVTDSIIEGESMNVQVQRLFRSLKIGEEFNYTDEEGSIMVPIDNDIPGVDGMLTFEVVLNDHDEYGTVKALISAPLGIPIQDESTFDERTMWSPRSKTPYFLLVVPTMLTMAMWGIILYLILTLRKIAKN
jgi:hypothetical protein